MRAITKNIWDVLAITLLVSLPTTGVTPQNKYTYVLKIRTPAEVQQLNGWRFLYKGDVLLPHNNLAKLTEKRCAFSFSLVVTPEVRCTSSTILSSLRHIELEPNEPARWFDLNLIFDKDIGTWRWEVVELSAQDIPKILPHHAIVFLYNPALIKSLEKPYKTAYSLDNIHEGGQCNFELPTIVLGGSREELEDALIYSQHAVTRVLSHHRLSPCFMQVIDGTHCLVDAT